VLRGVLVANETKILQIIQTAPSKPKNLMTL
jgi:hypothetical protein